MTDSTDGRPPLLLAQEALHAMPGYRVKAKLALLERISGILQGNVADFRRHVARMDDPSFALPVLDVRNPQEYDRFLNEVERLLHNVVASVKTRVELQRNFIRTEWQGSRDFLDGELKDRVSKFSEDGPSRFLEGLRNYMLHHRLPLSFSSVDFWPDRCNFSLILSAPSLLESDRSWVAVARSWLETSASDINVGAMIEDYATRVHRFDCWLQKKLAEKYSVELAQFDGAARIFNEKYAQTFGF